MNKSLKYFDPETLASIRPLGLRAKTLVEGLVSGLHRSPLRGHSAEFAQHREYVPGDDLRQVDWKVYARSDRYYLKQYEDETNLRCYILVDQSESMQYRGQNSHLSKFEYAQLIACALGHLIVSQQDQAGLVTYTSRIEHWLPASNSPAQLDDFVQILEAPATEQKTDLTQVLSDTAGRLQKPTLLILLSDMLDEFESVSQALKLLAHARHDLVLLHIFDPDELDFPFDHTTQFDGLENLPSLTTDPLLIAGAYRKAMKQFQHDLERVCRQQNSDYFSLRTSESLALQLPRILASRARS